MRKPDKRGGGGIRKDSASGNHSAGLANFGATADHKSCSTPKFAKNYESNTAIPRILEEYKQAGREDPYRDRLSPESTFDKSPNSNSNAHFLSLRDTALAVAWQSIQTNPLESIFSHNAANIMDRPHAARDDRKNAKNEDSSGQVGYPSLRGVAEAIHKENAQDTQTLESTFEKAQMDCHALPSGKARNDRGGSALACNDEKNAISKKVDSSTATTPSLRGGGLPRR